MLLIGSLSLVEISSAWAQKNAGPIGHVILEEIHDAPSKSYTVKFEVWSTDKGADLLKVTPRTESEKLKILTPKSKSWSRLKRDQKRSHSVRVQNLSAETQILLLDVQRRVGKVVDSKTISIMVAAP